MQALLNALPSNTGFPYVLVQHLFPDYKSLLCEILSRHTAMPVLQIEDGMAVEPNHVYVIHPGKNVEIADGCFHLSDKVDQELNLPIDIFFRSLATEAGSHAIAIILSGTGSDGSNGIRSIKENGGMVLVQDYESSQFDGMPKSAMRTGIVDAQMTISSIAAEIVHISVFMSDPDKAQRISTPDSINDELMQKAFFLLKQICNTDFSQYKKATVVRRMARRMILAHNNTLADYIEYLTQTPNEVRCLSKEILIGVTNFFRDPELFAALKHNVIQKLVTSGNPEDPIRVWVAGCSTGEEAYSVAMLISEVMEETKIKRSVRIFATDLDDEAIITAGKGIYSNNIADTVSISRLIKYFTFQDGNYVVQRSGSSIDETILEQFLTGCLIVNARNQVVHSYGDCSNYAHLSLGRFSDDLFDIITDALKAPASTILKEARDKKKAVQYKEIAFIGQIKNEVICLTAVPVDKNPDDETGLYAVSVQCSKQPIGRGHTVRHRPCGGKANYGSGAIPEGNSEQATGERLQSGMRQ